ncbi:g12074 [Coccomyxa viridis]|uniref:Pre-mRNA-splicing factor 18 n=1 Tax=Coccomyxa viridis TaxID=1274662 RepID=A0ABP1GF27_9CHLO
MDALKALLEKKRQAAQAIDTGGKKFVKHSVIEDARLKRLREEEQQETLEKELRKRQRSGEEAHQLQRIDSVRSQEEELSREEVIRRLRLLGQPITLFGETDEARQLRLRKAQEDYQLEDEHRGGHLANSLLAIEKEDRATKRLGSADPSKKAAKPDSHDVSLVPVAEEAEEGAEEQEEEDETARLFRLAAEQLREKREEEAMSVEERILKYMQKWCQAWEDDLENRSIAVKCSGPGNQATMQFKQTMQFFQPLFKLLKRKAVLPEMVAGLDMIVEDIKQRNYLHAYDIYMRLAIGTNPWPIGVTSVGIHERSSREKISHVMNGAAHIMNDEATRKYLSAVKRLLTFVQRAYPTDPSRCVDFDGFRNPSRGAAGGGSDKLAMLEAERDGKGWKELGLLPAPHFHDKDGSVKVPSKWENIVRGHQVFSDSSSKTPPRTPPKTPPRSPLPQK